MVLKTEPKNIRTVTSKPEKLTKSGHEMSHEAFCGPVPGLMDYRPNFKNKIMTQRAIDILIEEYCVGFRTDWHVQIFDIVPSTNKDGEPQKAVNIYVDDITSIMILKSRFGMSGYDLNARAFNKRMTMRRMRIQNKYDVRTQELCVRDIIKDLKKVTSLRDYKEAKRTKEHLSKNPVFKP